MPAVVTTLYSMGTRGARADTTRIVKRLPVGRDARIGLGHLLGQDRHADAQQDDRPRVHGPRPEPLHGHRRGLQHRRARCCTTAARSSTLDEVLLPMALCADARLDGEALIGDPTEGALIVLAAKGGIDVDERARALPARRRGAVRLRLQVHGDVPRHDGRDRAGRSCAASSRARRTCSSTAAATYWMPDGERVAITDDNRQLALDENERMAKAGERVMVVARRDFDPATLRPGRRPARPGEGPDAARDGRHRRPAARRGQATPSPSATAPASRCA